MWHCDNRDLFIIDTIDRDYKCVVYLGTVIRNRRGKESLAKKCLHFSYKNILAKYSKNMKQSPKNWHYLLTLVSSTEGGGGYHFSEKKIDHHTLR